MDIVLGGLADSPDPLAVRGIAPNRFGSDLQAEDSPPCPLSADARALQRHPLPGCGTYPLLA